MVLGVSLRYIFLGLVLGAELLAAQGPLSMSPHYYDGPRGDEPQSQVLVQTVPRWSGGTLCHWKISTHFQGEVRGRKDLSLDLDEIWGRCPVSESELTLGRIHPWTLSQMPYASWGMASHYQSRNLGVALGYGLGETTLEPHPILLGWLGLHFWSSTSAPLQLGFSVTPLFVPTLGSEVDFSNGEVSTGRFGRRPPGFVEIEGAELPIRYSLETGNVFRDILLNPQAAVQLKWNHPVFPGWASVMCHPSAEPTSNASGFLRVSGEDVHAQALIRPSFPYQWTTTLLQKIVPFSSPWLPHLELTWVNVTPGTNAYEIALTNEFLRVGYADEFSPLPADPQTEISYTQKLFSADGRIAWAQTTLTAGIRWHRDGGDYWWRAGVAQGLGNQLKFLAGVDVFSGLEGTYFAEWRTNDRIWAAVEWEIGP